MRGAIGRKGFALAGFALLLALFVGLRVFDLTADPPADLDGSGGIYFDEGMLAQGARNKILFGNFFQDDWNDLYISPLLSLLKLAVLSVTGVGLLQVRLVAVAFGLGSLLLFYLILRRGAGRPTALLGVTLLGCSHLFGMFNRIGLTETPVCFFMLLAGWLWQEGVLRRGARWHLFGAGAAAFVAYTVKAFPYFIPALALATVLAWWLQPAAERSLGRPGARQQIALAAAALLAGIALPLALWYFAFYRRFAASIEQASAFYRAQQIPASAAALLKDLVGVPFFRYFSETPALLFLSVLFIGLCILLWFHRRGRLLPLDLFFVSWFVAHFAMFAVLQYRPVRYYLPIVPPMVAMAARAMLLLGDRAGLSLPRRLSPAALALLCPWLAVSLYYGVPQLVAQTGRWGGRTPSWLTPERLVVGAVAGTLALFAAAAVLAARLGGRRIPVPRGAALAVCVLLPTVVSLAVDARNWQQWAAARRHVIRDTSREFGAAIPDAYIAGLGAPTISLENRNRALHAHERFFNGNDTFARFPLTHLFMGGRNREVDSWYRRYPAEMRYARVLRAIAVKKDHYYLYSLVEPTVEAVALKRQGEAGSGGTVATITVRNNDPRRARDIEAALLVRSAGNARDALLPAAIARAVPAGGSVDVDVPGPLPPGAGRLLGFVQPALEHRFEAEYLAHRTGAPVRREGASNAEVWEATAPGSALFGPGLRYPPGVVQVSFRLAVAPPAAGPVAILRVTADRGRTVLAERCAYAAEFGRGGEFVDLALPEAALEQEQALEFTAETVGGAKVAFDQVLVVFRPGVWAGSAVP